MRRRTSGEKTPGAFLLSLPPVSGSESAQEPPFVTPLTASASLLATVNLIEYEIDRSEQGAGNKTTRSAITQGIFYELYTLVYIRSNQTVIKVQTDDGAPVKESFLNKGSLQIKEPLHYKLRMIPDVERV